MMTRTGTTTQSAERKIAGHRVCEPTETLARIRPFLRTMGITRLADITGLDMIGIPVAQAVRPMGRSLSVSQGKGRTIEAAFASAAMEAVEMWHAEFADLDHITASRADLHGSGHNTLEIRHLVPASDHYDDATRDAWENTPMRWVSGRNLVDGRTVLVPFDTVHMDLTQEADTEFLPRSSNGLAGGNTMSEAIASALHEVIERDCTADFAKLEKLKQSARRIDTEALAKKWLSAAWMIGLVEETGLAIDLFDMTNDIGIPTVSARIYDRAGARAVGDLSPHAVGAGTHLDPETAVTRAITEAAQSRLTKISGTRDDLQRHRYKKTPAANFAERLHYMADMVEPRIGTFAHADNSAGTAAEDVQSLVDSLTSAGIRQIVAVDLTKPEIGIPVVRCIVPGLGRKVRGRFAEGTRQSNRKVMQ